MPWHPVTIRSPYPLCDTSVFCTPCKDWRKVHPSFPWHIYWKYKNWTEFRILILRSLVRGIERGKSKRHRFLITGPLGGCTVETRFQYGETGRKDKKIRHVNVRGRVSLREQNWGRMRGSEIIRSPSYFRRFGNGFDLDLRFGVL